jgi:hypothetical protein
MENLNLISFAMVIILKEGGDENGERILYPTIS